MWCPDLQVIDYCEDCGRIQFECERDPPWNYGGIHASPPFDFFRVSPFGYTFVSENAANVMQTFKLSGVDLQAADDPFGHDVANRRSTMGLPPEWLDREQLAFLWKQVVELDRRGCLDGKRPPARVTRDEV